MRSSRSRKVIYLVSPLRFVTERGRCSRCTIVIHLISLLASHNAAKSKRKVSNSKRIKSQPSPSSAKQYQTKHPTPTNLITPHQRNSSCERKNKGKVPFE